MWTDLFYSFPTSYKVMQQWYITQLLRFLNVSLFCDLTLRRRHTAEDNLRSNRSENLASLHILIIIYHRNNSPERADKKLLNNVRINNPFHSNLHDFVVSVPFSLLSFSISPLYDLGRSFRNVIPFLCRNIHLLLVSTAVSSWEAMHHHFQVFNNHSQTINF
jgi:hypothetical protein